MSKRHDPKHELERLMRESERKSRMHKVIIDGLARSNQQVTDLAQSSLEALKYTPPEYIDYERAIPAWQRLNAQQDALDAGLAGLSYHELMAGTASSATGTFSMYEVDQFVEFAPPSQREHLRLAFQRLDYVRNDLADKAEVVELLRAFGLDRAPAGQKSPLELFQIAWEAYEKPVTDTSPSNTSLISIRDSIKAAIDALFQRRPEQEPAKGWRGKIISLGAQAGRPATSEVDFVDLADQWTVKTPILPAIEDELSTSKRANLDRATWLRVLCRATLFLKQLLLSIDPVLLRPMSE